MAEALFAVVVTDQAVDKPLDYALPPPMRPLARVGMRVTIPLRGRKCRGTILSLKQSSPFTNVKPIALLHSEETLLPDDLMQLGIWMARYYAAPMSRVLHMLLPPPIRKEVREKQQLFVSGRVTGKEMAAACAQLQRSAPQQARVIEKLLKAPLGLAKGLPLADLLEVAGVSRSAVDSLVKKGLISCTPQVVDRSFLLNEEYFPTKPKKLSGEQQEALERITQTLEESRFQVHLLHGVTGSGKTEVYLQAIHAALERGKGVLFLAPEIALTSQLVEKLKGRFRERVALLHHRLSQGERRDAWLKIKGGEIPLVIGARSALFSPIPHLGLILVDEEHEGAYKQSEEAPCYHARDLAIMRAKILSAPIILGSATPSLESYYNAQQQRYLLSRLSARPGGVLMPKVAVVDMQREFEKRKGFTLFSDALLKGIEERIRRGEQTLLFLNRRGYHSAQLCASCGKTVLCPDCEISLTLHLGANLLACHLCDYRLSPPPRSCPHCSCQDAFKYKGAGTEMVERSLHALFPELRTLRLDADTTKRKGSHEELYKQFRSGKADLLIGTQMIAKGLHFPAVTLVGILNADAGLYIPDFRASEQVFQLITQVAGRAGRGEIPGEVLIQTHIPEHPIIQAAARQDYEAFYTEEIISRELLHYPPFAKLVKVVLSGPVEREALLASEELRSSCIRVLPPTYQIHPVVPCGHAKIKGRYRFQFLIKGGRQLPSLEFLQAFRPKYNQRLLIDVDPLSTFF